MREKEEYLNPIEAATILKVSERTVRHYLAEGVLPYTKPQGRIYIKMSHLIAFLENKLERC